MSMKEKNPAEEALKTDSCESGMSKTEDNMQAESEISNQSSADAPGAGGGQAKDSDNCESAQDKENDCEITKYKKLSEEYLHHVQRLQAEFDNYRKREEKAKLNLKDTVIQSVMADFLPLVDNFERAMLSTGNQNITLESFTEGIRLIFQQLENFLSRLNIVRINALDKEFDPHFHDAVSKTCSDKYKENHVMEILQNGWIMNETVIRPAMVVVSGGMPEESPESSKEQT